MKANIVKIGLVLLGTFGLLLIAPKKKDTIKNLKDMATSFYKKKIEPEKINFC